MASLSSGAPLSVLLDHGMPESVLEALIAAGVGTVERVGSMTPEELEQISGIDGEAVQQMSTAINSYYTQMDAAAAGQEVSPVVAAPVEIASADAEVVPADAELPEPLEAEPAAEALAAPELDSAGAEILETEGSEAAQAPADDSDTMGSSGLPVDPSGH
jgi:N utilization substance protein A